MKETKNPDGTITREVEIVHVPPAYCPRCGVLHERQAVTASDPASRFTLCVRCLTPLHRPTTPHVFLEVVDLDAIPIAARNEYERVIAMLEHERDRHGRVVRHLRGNGDLH